MTYMTKHNPKTKVTMENWRFNCGAFDKEISKIVSEAINISIENYSLSCDFDFPFVGDYWLHEDKGTELQFPKSTIEALAFGIDFTFDDNPVKFAGNLWEYFAKWIAEDNPIPEARSAMSDALRELANMIDSNIKS